MNIVDLHWDEPYLIVDRVHFGVGSLIQYAKGVYRLDIMK